VTYYNPVANNYIIRIKLTLSIYTTHWIILEVENLEILRLVHITGSHVFENLS